VDNSAVGLTGILSRYVQLRIILLAAVGTLPVGAVFKRLAGFG
jgi:hypothetical protein